jgi:uroporphyrinogen-III synthase
MNDCFAQTHPLRGLRVLVTRPAEQAGELLQALRAVGAHPVLQSTIEIKPLEDTRALDAALRRLHGYEWVIFTSANGVRHVWDRLQGLDPAIEEVLEEGENGRRPGQPRVAAIGPATAAALERRGARPDYVPPEYVAEALAAGLPGAEGASILLLRAADARAALRELLQARGARVEDVAAYRTVLVADEEHSDRISGAVDAVTFTSPSTVQGCMSRGGRIPDGVTVACIGPVTAQAARRLGLRVDVVAERYTTEGLVEALVEHFAARRGSTRA